MNSRRAAVSLTFLLLSIALGNTEAILSAEAAEHLGAITADHDRPGKPDFDIRLPAREQDRGGFVMRAPTTDQLAAAGLLRAETADLTLRWDGMSGGPKWLAAAAGRSLSAPSAGEPDEIARSFLRRISELFSLTPRDIDSLHVSSTVRARGGGWHVYFTQRVEGLEVFGGRVNVNLRPDGAVRSMGSRLYANVERRAPNVLDAVEAVRLAVRDVYPEIGFTGEVISADDQGERLTVLDGTGFAWSPQARLVLFPTAEDARLAWEVRIVEPSLTTSYVILIDAADGRLLYRTNTTVSAEARYIDAEHPQPEGEEFAPDQHVLEPIPSVTPESPNGWISGDGTTLEGNNAVSHLHVWSGPPLSDPTGQYDYPFNNTRSALVNAWWWVNDAHDRFYALGFDEQAGNFQQDNFGLGGIGGDPMHVTAYSEGCRDNAYSTPMSADGGLAVVRFCWIDCRFCGDHDGFPENGGERHSAFSRDIIFHEYTHGVSKRIVGGPADVSCLSGIQSSAMWEGWSDVFPKSLFNESPRGGAYFFEGFGWGRDMRHDLTYDDLCGVGDDGCQSHYDGMIWGGALWDLRESLRALDPATGVDTFHQLVLGGLNRIACNPTMVDGRDALLDADDSLYGSAHEELIRNVFAARGMGKDASSTHENDTAPVTDYTVANRWACTPPSMPTGLTAVPEGDNAIRLSYVASGAAAVEIWRDDLDNAFDRAMLIDYTTDPATFLDSTVQGGKSYRYHLVALGTAGKTCRSDASGTADATASGTCTAYPVFDPGLTISDGDPSCALTLSWTAALPGCPGSGDPIVYNIYRAPRPGFNPSDRLLVGQTGATTFQDTPPESLEDYGFSYGNTYYYLVLAQHGSPGDPPDHRDRGTTQLLRWAPGVPTLGRETVQFWDFDSGAPGWTTNNANDPSGAWVRVDPSPTHYGGALFAPDEAAGGSGMAWVTGDAGGPSSVTAHDCDGINYLDSPTWDGTDGATILSFDYWAHTPGNFKSGLDLAVKNGTGSVGVRIAGFLTAQPFETAGRHGWQRAELDLATVIAPSSTMWVRFYGSSSGGLDEYGIDNVRVERATACARSGLSLQTVTVDDGPSGWGNGNGVLEPGETARLSVQLRNDGSVTAFSPGGTLSCSVPGALVHDETAAFPDIPPAASALSTGDGFTVTLPDDADCEESAVFEFEFTDAAGTTSHASWSPEFGYPVTDVVFSDDFETDKNWIILGDVGKGRWQRGDPVGTTDGSNQANPENDSPNDAGAACYVTENGLPGGDAGLTDVDAGGSDWPRLLSPAPGIDITAYKRTRLAFDLWFYDNSTATPSQDYAEYRSRIIGENPHHTIWKVTGPTSGWLTVNKELTTVLPRVPDARISFHAYDTSTDHIVEMGIDNVVLEGDRQVCDPLGVDHPPNGVGNTVRVDKSGGGAEISWQASPVDASHDGAAYYELHVSGAPDAGFSVADTTTTTRAVRPLDGPAEYYAVTAVNSAGTSGDEPAP